MTLPAWVLLFPLAIFMGVMVYFTKKVCDDLKYCITHTVRNSAQKKWEFEQMKKAIERLSK